MKYTIASVEKDNTLLLAFAGEKPLVLKIVSEKKYFCIEIFILIGFLKWAWNIFKSGGRKCLVIAMAEPSTNTGGMTAGVGKN